VKATPRLDTTSRFDGQRGPNGFRLCRQCGTECDSKRKTFCAQPCVEQWKLERWPAVQRCAVEERDRGVCQRCGLCIGRIEDRAKALHKRLARLTYGRRWPQSAPEQAERDLARAERNASRLGRALARYGVRYQFRRRGYVSHVPHLWEMDHKVPLAEGGTNALDNLRTLCIPCHRKVTAELAGRRAKRARRRRTRTRRSAA
jgi:5-methylcytosine-specific restriction protein A